MATQVQAQHEKITLPIALQLIEDMAEVGVRGVSLVSDGESTLSKAYVPFIKRGHELGVSMASGTNGERLTRDVLEQVLPCLTYLRINFSGGTRERYSDIMGVEPEFYDRVCENIRTAVEIKRRDNLPVTIGMQMVLMPEDGDQILPFARLGKELGVGYNVIKHTSDTTDGRIGVDYSKYPALYETLREAEALSTEDYQVTVKWSKIKDGKRRSYERCFAAPFLLQISGTGLLAPCGMLFEDRFSEYHIANVATDRFRDIIKSERYWKVMDRLRSPDFSTDICASLCLQHLPNIALDNHVRGLEILTEPVGPPPAHVNFI